MVCVGVMEEVKIKSDTQGDLKVQYEGIDEPQEYKKKDVPLEKMKKAELLKKIKGIQESVEKNFDLYVRSQAEMDNIKKRFQKEKEELIKFSNESLIKQILPVMDNLEKAIIHAQENDSYQALLEGVGLTLRGLKDVLVKGGLEEVKAVGEAFDPNFHESISEQKDDSIQSGTVLKELQKGYTLNNRLIRPALVVVSKNATGDSENRGDLPKKME